MTDKNLLKQLENLQQVKPSGGLHQKIHQQVGFLEDHHKGFYLPLFTFQMGIVAAVLLLCILATSGIVVAAAHSPKNTPLYPVKVLIQKVVPSFIEQKQVKGEVAPTPTAIPTEEVGTPSAESKNKDAGRENEESRTISPTREEKHEGLLQEVTSLGKKQENHGINNGDIEKKEQNTEEDLLH